MTGPPQKDVDFIAFKDFPFAERMSVQFRAEFFNIFNHANFGLPDGNVQDSAFGTINSAGPPREIQFALKLTF
jgi:hypothetical protein